MTHPSDRSAQISRRTLALLVAPLRRSGLHELTEEECSAALPFAHGLRVVDFQLGNLARAGISEVIVLQPGLAQSRLCEHIRRVWSGSFDRMACLANPIGPDGLTRATLRRYLALIDRIGPDDLLLLSADHICETDLGGLIAAHRRERNLLTLGAHSAGDDIGTGAVSEWIAALHVGVRTGIGAMILDWHWLRNLLARTEMTVGALSRQVIMAASREAGLQIRDIGDPGLYWRRLDCLDTFRVTWLDFIDGPVLPCALPCPPDLPPDLIKAAEPLPSPQPNVRDSVIMPGGSVGPRALVSRAIIAPGAHVPDGMVIGHDPDFDARRFRLTTGGTILVTARMLAAETVPV